MSKPGDWYSKVVNFGIREDWDFDKKRAYRQVNKFNLALCLISFSAWPVALGFKIYLGFLIQFTGFILYTLGFHLVAKEKLKEARLLAITTFESHMFVITFFAIHPTERSFMPWISPVFASYMLYPLVAALFDKPIFKHMIFAFLQILTIQLIGGVLVNSGFPFFPEGEYDTLNIIVCIYTTSMATILVYLIYSENRYVKDMEIERSKDLQKALEDVEASRAMINEQAVELKKLNNSKDKFFSIVAHDLKSPYNTLLGFSAMLKEKTREDSEAYEDVRNLYDIALNNYNLLENLLEWSRSQMSHIQFTPTNFSLNDVVLKTMNLVGINADKKKITIVNMVNNSLNICADRNLVNIIVRNILTNAIKYTYPAGKITIAAKTGDKFAEVSIADDGMGMPESISKNLFTIDNKISTKGTASETGTGLGLILCKEFIELHGCKIWVESQPKTGSTFYFTLPLSGK